MKKKKQVTNPSYPSPGTKKCCCSSQLSTPSAKNKKTKYWRTTPSPAMTEKMGPNTPSLKKKKT